VQGVWYRGWVVETAASLGLDGWVRNCRDGSVEAVFSGASEAVDVMLANCHQGPASALVTSVTTSDQSDPPPPGFVQLPNHTKRR
jgi:acylphosphatase